MDEAKGVRLLMAAWDLIAASGGTEMLPALASAGPLGGKATRWARDREDVQYVATARGGYHDLIDDQVTGMPRRPGDATSLVDRLRRDVADVDWDLALGNAARRSYEAHFSPEVGIAGYERGIAASWCWNPL